MNVLITGANRGIGLEFTSQYAEAGCKVIACCRDVTNAQALQQLAAVHAGISIEPLDVEDFAQIDALASKLTDSTIDLLINNAGVYHGSDLGHLDYAGWAQAFKVNAMAPCKMVEAFRPQLLRSDMKKIATLTSKMGSIGDNSSGGSYLYRSSKTALNMVMKSLAIDLKPEGISLITLQPGWVQTRMGGSNALISSELSVSGMRKLIDDLTLASSGSFVAYDGKHIPW